MRKMTQTVAALSLALVAALFVVPAVCIAAVRVMCLLAGVDFGDGAKAGAIMFGCLAWFVVAAATFCAWDSHRQTGA